MDIVDGVVSLVKEYISVENISAIPFLILIGNKLKRSKRVADNLIPDILSLLGVCCSLVFGLSNNRPYDIVSWLVLVIVSVGQGYFMGMCSVGIHQQFKQRKVYEILDVYDNDEPRKKVKLKKIVKKEVK